MVNNSACIWCGCRAALVEGKPYCSCCSSRCLRECVSCHKPYPNLKYFAGSSPRCNSCQVKLERAKKRVSFRVEQMEKPTKHKPNKLISDDEEEVIDVGSRSPSPCSSVVSSDGEEKVEKVTQREGETERGKKKKKKVTAERQMKIGEFFNAINSAEVDEKKRAPKRKCPWKKSTDPDEIMTAEREWAAALAKYNRVLGKRCEFNLRIT